MTHATYFLFESILVRQSKIQVPAPSNSLSVHSCLKLNQDQHSLKTKALSLCQTVVVTMDTGCLKQLHV